MLKREYSSRRLPNIGVSAKPSRCDLVGILRKPTSQRGTGKLQTPAPKLPYLILINPRNAQNLNDYSQFIIVIVAHETSHSKAFVRLKSCFSAQRSMCQGSLRRFFGTLDQGFAGADGKRDLASSEMVLLRPPIPEDAALVRTSVQLLLVIKPSRLV